MCKFSSFAERIKISICMLIINTTTLFLPACTSVGIYVVVSPDIYALTLISRSLCPQPGAHVPSGVYNVRRAIHRCPV